MLSVLTFFIVLSILILVHELGHFLVAKKNGVYVEEFGFGLPPRLWGFKYGETIYSINWLPFGGFVKVLGEEREELEKVNLPPEIRKRTFAQKSNKVKLAILLAGVTANFLLGWFTTTILFIKGVPVITNKTIIDDVAVGSPAQQAGIKEGDVVTAVIHQGKKYDIELPDTLTKTISDLKGEPILLEINRQNELVKLNLTPRVDPPKGEGSLGVVITQFQTVTYPWYKAPFYALVEAAKITVVIVRELGKFIINLVTFSGAKIDVAGPVGIAKITSDAVKIGFDAVLQLLGLLSLNLAVINILPFPALDGGRVAFVLYEIVRKKPVRPSLEKKLNYAGFAILISLIILMTIYDILKIVK